MQIYNQRDTRWASTLMGKGVGGSTIGKFGCYLSALAQGLTDLGIEYTPATLNKSLLDRGLWDDNNYIKVDQIAAGWPELFVSFQKVEPWVDMAQLQQFLNEKKIIVCKVDARGIGGSGTHFVKAEKIDGANVWIKDPWHGDLIKVADRYNKFGNILGLRVFTVKIGNEEPGCLLTNSEKDRATFTRLVDNSSKADKVVVYLGLGPNADGVSYDTIEKSLAARIGVADGVRRDLSAAQQEIKNRTEQVSRLNDQLAEQEKQYKAEITALNNNQINPEEITKPLKTRIEALTQQNDTLAKQKGECLLDLSAANSRNPQTVKSFNLFDFISSLWTKRA